MYLINTELVHLKHDRHLKKKNTRNKYGRNTVNTLCIMHICDSFLLTLCVILFFSYFFFSEKDRKRDQ